MNEKSAFRKNEVLDNYDLSKFKYDAMLTDKYLMKEDFATSCFFCGSYVKYVFCFTYPNDKTKFFAGADCADMVDSGTNFEALRLQAAKARERARMEQIYLDTAEEFTKDYPQLAQAAEYFKKDNYLIEDIFSKTRYGLTEKQIAFLEKLCIESWEGAVNSYKKEMLKAKMPDLELGEFTTKVKIVKYYTKEKEMYYQHKVVFETPEGNSIFTGRTLKLVYKMILMFDYYEEDYLADIWKTTKADRKSTFKDGCIFYEEETEGIATFDITWLMEDKKSGGGKLKNFSPIYIKETIDYGI